MGPTTKLVVALIKNGDDEPEALDRWTSDAGDIRHNDQVLMEHVQWLKANAVQRVLNVDHILGCPHEEGIDDPPLIYSSHCQIVELDSVTLDAQIYRIPDSDWALEVVDEKNTSFVWEDEFDNDTDAWAEFQRTLREEGLRAFADVE